MQLRLVDTLARTVYYCQRLGQHAQPLFGLPCLPIRLRQQGKIIWPLQLRSRRPPSRYALAHLRNPLRALPLLGQRPAPQDRRARQVEGESLLRAQCNLRLSPLLCGLPLPAELVEFSSKAEGIGQGKGVSWLPSPSERLVNRLEGLVRIAQTPQCQGCMGEGSHRRVLPIEETMGTALLRVVEGHRLRQVRSGSGQLPQPEQGCPQCPMGFHEERRVVCTLGQAEKLLHQLPRRLEVRPH